MCPVLGLFGPRRFILLRQSLQRTRRWSLGVWTLVLVMGFVLGPRRARITRHLPLRPCTARVSCAFRPLQTGAGTGGKESGELRSTEGAQSGPNPHGPEREARAPGRAAGMPIVRLSVL